MKYKLYRSFGDLEKDIKKHELIAVEYGSAIEDVEEALIKDVTDDLSGDAEYAGCETSAYAPEPIKSFRKVKRYNYEMMGIVYPPHAETNVLIDFGIIEKPEDCDFEEDFDYPGRRTCERQYRPAGKQFCKRSRGCRSSDRNYFFDEK